MWLMENEGLSEPEAYDKARKEFYKLRLEQDVERQVAKEEAQYVGAKFGKGPNEIAMAFENQQWQNWKKWAEETVERRKHEQMAMYTGMEAIDEPEIQAETSEAVPDETVDR
jgi:small subunit ribosomal protein S23